MESPGGIFITAWVLICFCIFSAILSGDYYMFEDMTDADLEDPTDVKSKESDKDSDDKGQVTISKVKYSYL